MMISDCPVHAPVAISSANRATLCAPASLLQGEALTPPSRSAAMAGVSITAAPCA